MARLKTFLVLSMLMLGLGLTIPAAQAQTPEAVVVIYPVAQDRGDSLALDVFFTITDAGGQPVSRASIDSASIQLVGPGHTPVPATVEDPQTPIFITLLLDASGSMANAIGSVREAAKAALDSAPPTAHFAVIQFNNEFRPLVDFTNDHARVKREIDRVQSISGSSTCLYDSTYDAIEMLEEQIDAPQERRAIILFTDGKDETPAGTPCSFYTYEDVIAQARPGNAPNTPIHTIGLCTDAQCSNINRSELRNMALDTVAFSATGSQTDLGNLFRQIMDGLNSQWVARANLYPRQGNNQAVLIVNLRDSETPLTTTFNFFSPKDYAPPLAPVQAQINSLTYDPAGDLYNLSLGLTSPQLVYQVIVQVWDVKAGTQVLPDQIFENPDPTLSFERNTEGFIPGRQYAFQIKALDREGNLIQLEDEGTILAEREVVYEPDLPDSISFAIESVNANFDTDQLVIDLNLPEDADIMTYDGFVVNEATGQRIHDFGPDLFPGKRIQEALPAAMAQATTPQKYRVTVYLTTRDENRTAAEEPYEFEAIPPPPPGLLTRISTALVTIPAILVSITIIVLSVVIWLVFRSRRSTEPELLAPKGGAAGAELRRPPVEHTMYVPGSQNAPQASQSFRLRLKLAQTADQPGAEQVLTQFPCILGRDPNAGPLEVGLRDQKSFVNVPSQGVSRRHAEIRIHNNQLYLVDLKSRNGTYINGSKLSPNTPRPLSGSTTIKLGRLTQIQVEPL